MMRTSCLEDPFKFTCRLIVSCDSERANKMGWVGGRSERAMTYSVRILEWRLASAVIACAVQWGVSNEWARACGLVEESCMEGWRSWEEGESEGGISQLLDSLKQPRTWCSTVNLLFAFHNYSSHGVLGVHCCRGRYSCRRFGRDCSPVGGVHQWTAEIHTIPGAKLQSQRDLGTTWTAQRYLRARGTQPSGSAEMRRQLPQ